LNVHFPRQ
jgi:predicted transposase/invertase (TIGR01784 family)